jgi:uncharacterized protein YjbI with pentapeptide repeats
MANPEHVAILKKGVEEWNRWYSQQDAAEPLQFSWVWKADLTGADLNGLDLRRVILRRVNLSSANLQEANLAIADLVATRLCDINLTNANLINANLSGADLRGAKLAGADITWANLRGCRLEGADLTGAVLDMTIMGDVDLTEVKGLTEVRHDGPSTIGIDTIYRSKGQIPEEFLRGCGVPESFITYSKSLVGKPIEFYSCFISYSTCDQEFADRLHADLQAKGVRCWFAPHHIQGGKKLHEQIDEAIRVYDRLLLILSDASMNSEWVKTEIAKARKKEVREGRRVLFPIRLCSYEELRDWECFDADTGKDSAREIREYFIPDFSNWKDHDSYQQAFQRLLRDLKAEQATGAGA